MTNMFKYIFIILAEDIRQKNSTWSWKSADSAKISSNFEKNISE